MRIALLLMVLCVNLAKGMVSHLIILEPNSSNIDLSNEDLNHFKITLFNAERSDSLEIPRYNNCYHFKGKLARYNGEFILYDKQIPYSEIKVEHPKFITSFYPLNKTIADEDSVDEFNKRHHILIHKTTLELEQNCAEAPNYDFLFWADKSPKGGFLYENLIGVLMQDSLSDDSLKSIATNNKLLFKSKSHTGKQVIFQLQKGKIKSKKNKILINLLNDSLRVKDAGILIDSNEYNFFSSFYKIHALTIPQIEKWKFEPISGLKSMSESTTYITDNELEMGCGLYKYNLGLGHEILKMQKETHINEANDRCEEQAKLVANDKEFVILHTKTFSISGGKDIGKKKRNNEQRMAEIHEDDKALKKQYNAPFGYIEPIILSTE